MVLCMKRDCVEDHARLKWAESVGSNDSRHFFSYFVQREKRRTLCQPAGNRLARGPAQCMAPL